eukprot:Gb_13881 [translate_table: standard]
MAFDPKKPLWEYCERTKSAKGAGGTSVIKCLLCNHKPFVGSYRRVKNHLLKIFGGGVGPCGCDEEQRKKMMNEQRIADGHPAQSPTPTSATPNTTPSSAIPVGGSNQAKAASSTALPEYMTRKRPPTGTMQSLFKIENRGEVDLAIARFFYSNGISFNVARSPYYGEMVKAIMGAPSGYKPPDFEKLRTTLVEKEKARVEEEVAPLKHAWSIDGCLIAMDGWTDICNRPLLNIIVSSTSGKYLFRAIDSGKEKNIFFLRDVLSVAIDEVGVSNVVQVITNVAPVCKVAGLLVHKKYKHIF